MSQIPSYLQELVDRIYALAEENGLVTSKPTTEAGLEDFLNRINQYLRSGQISAQAYQDACSDWLKKVPDLIHPKLTAERMNREVVQFLLTMVFLGVCFAMMVRHFNNFFVRPAESALPPNALPPAFGPTADAAPDTSSAESLDLQTASAIVKEIVDDTAAANKDAQTAEPETDTEDDNVAKHTISADSGSKSDDEDDADEETRISLAALTLTSGDGIDVNALIFSTPRSGSASPSPVPSPRSNDEQLQREAKRLTRVPSVTPTSATIEDDGSGNERSRTPSPR